MDLFLNSAYITLGICTGLIALLFVLAVTATIYNKLFFKQKDKRV